MKAAQYHIKRREYLGQVTRAFGGYVASYTAWQTYTTWPDLAAAQTAMDSSPKAGLWQYAIWHRGKRLPT